MNVNILLLFNKSSNMWHHVATNGKPILKQLKNWLNCIKNAYMIAIIKLFHIQSTHYMGESPNGVFFSVTAANFHRSHKILLNYRPNHDN